MKTADPFQRIWRPPSDWHGESPPENGDGSNSDQSAETPERPEPTFTSVRALCREHPELRQPIIHGMLREGETANIVGASKSMKSYLALSAAASVASGRLWLDTFRVEPGDVLVLDNELHRETLANRIPKVVASMGLTLDSVADRLYVESMRGRLRDIHSLAGYFRAVPQGRFRLIVLDALYRLLPAGTDENSNADMASIYNAIDGYADHIGCAFLVVHHSSKGVQAGKEVRDTGAGAGAQSRAADSHIVLRQHEEDGCAVLEAIVRSFPPVHPLCLRWDYPVWRPAPELDPLALRTAPKRHKAVVEDEPVTAWTVEEFVRRFIRQEPRTEDAITCTAGPEVGSERKAKRLLSAAIDTGIVFRWTYANPSQKHRFATIRQPVTATGETA